MSDSVMLVWGAGAIGGTVAAYLRRGGLDISVVDANVAHIQAIRERGLTITGPIENFTQLIPAFTPDDVDGKRSTIFLAVKAQQTEAAARQLETHLAANGVVVSLQNGFNELAIAQIVGSDRTMGAFINFGADLLEPGVVHFGGRGAVVIGELDGRESQRAADVRRALAHFEPAATVSDNIWGYLWGKMGYGAILFATAPTNASIVETLESSEVRPVLTELACEVMAVAEAEGVIPKGFNGYDPAAFAPITTGTARGGRAAAIDASFAVMAGFNRKSAKTHTGVWRDIAVHHRKTEAEAQFTPILTIAHNRNIPVPRLERLVSLMRDVENSVRPQHWANLLELKPASAEQPIAEHSDPRAESPDAHSF